MWVAAAGEVAVQQPRAVRVEPRVQLQAALVRLLDGEGQRIVERLRRLAHRAGEILRPGLDAGGIERVAGGPDLEDDGVQLELDGPVEHGHQFRFLLLGAQRLLGGPIDVRDRRDPGAAEFPQRRRRDDAGGFVVRRARCEGCADRRQRDAEQAAAERKCRSRAARRQARPGTIRAVPDGRAELLGSASGGFPAVKLIKVIWLREAQIMGHWRAVSRVKFLANSCCQTGADLR